MSENNYKYCPWCGRNLDEVEKVDKKNPDCKCNCGCGKSTTEGINTSTEKKVLKG